MANDEMLKNDEEDIESYDLISDLNVRNVYQKIILNAASILGYEFQNNIKNFSSGQGYWLATGDSDLVTALFELGVVFEAAGRLS